MAPKVPVIVGTASANAAGHMALDLHVVQNASMFRSSTSPRQPAAAEPVAGGTVAVPDAHEVHQMVFSGQLSACVSKKNRTARQIQSQLNYIQRYYGLETGVQGGWSLVAQDALEQWLLQETKGT